MYLSVNIITGSPSKFYEMGQWVDDVLVPSSCRRYQCTAEEAARVRERLEHMRAFKSAATSSRSADERAQL
jgi:hypothetical protein